MYNFQEKIVYFIKSTGIYLKLKEEVLKFERKC
jgi:hypothetical protein